MSRAAISLATGLEDPEKVTVALLMAVGAAESGRDTMVFMTKEAVRLGTRDMAVGVACAACPSIQSLMDRLEAAGASILVCPLCFNAKALDEATLLPNAELGGTVPLWEWISDGATTFSF